MSPRSEAPAGLGWGILATGGIARLFAKDLTAHGYRVEAVGSRTLESARAFAQEHDVPRAHGSYEDLVADPEVDVVYVATPHTFHASNARLALEHGKHVLVEKAFTLNAHEAREITELARDRGLVVMEAMWTRFLPHMADVRTLLAEGAVGEVHSLHADHTQHLPFDETHRLNDLCLGGGALLDLGVYPISFAHDVLGPPVDIAARATFKPTGVDASVATIFTHGDGAVSTTYSSMETRGRNQATILGTAGRIEIAATWYAPATVTLHDARGALVREMSTPVTGRGMQFQAAEVERLVRAGATAGELMAPQDSVLVMETMDRVRDAIGLRYPGE